MTSQETTKKFFHSSGAATFSQVWRAGVTLLVQILLRNLVSPEYWGLWDWTLVVFLVGGAVRDLGLVYHVVRVEPRPYANLLALEAGWGSALALGGLFAAPLVAMAAAEPHPDAVPVIRALTLFLLLEGLSSVPKAFFDAELQVGRTLLPEIVRNLLFAGISVGLAISGAQIWSLVIAQLVASGYYTVHLWVRAWGKMPLRWQHGQMGGLLAKSLPLALIWFLAILVANVDPLILAARNDMDVVGHYGYAYKFAFLVSAIVVPAMTRTVYPALVAFRKEPGRLMEAYRLGTLFVLACEAPAAAFLLFNPRILQEIAPGKWNDSVVAFVVILCFAPLIDPFSRLGGEVLKTYGKDKVWIAATAVTLISFAGFGWFFTGRYGPIGMAWANFLQLGGLIMAWAIYSISPAVFKRLAKDLLFVYLVPAATFGLAALTVRFAIPGDDVFWPRVALSLVAALVTVAVYYRRFGRIFIDFFKGGEAAS